MVKHSCLVLMILLAGCHRFQIKTDSIMRVPDGLAGKMQVDIAGQIDNLVVLVGTFHICT